MRQACPGLNRFRRPRDLPREGGMVPPHQPRRYQMKTLQSRALVVAIASVLCTAAHAQSSGNASWNAYRSIVNPSVVVDDSFNRSSEVDTRIDNSRSAEDSFNRETDIDTRIATDNSRSAEDSFNRETDIDTRIATDNSRSTADSFNR